MKTFVAVLFVVALAAAKPLSDEAKEKMKAINEECAKDSGIEEGDLLKVLEEAGDDSKVKEHMFCFQEKLGIINADGEIQKDVLKEKLVDFFDDDAKVEDIITKCAEEKDSPLETAFSLGSCIHQEKGDK
nr:odorant binding protein [Semanotus bifasciatus]